MFMSHESLVKAGCGVIVVCQKEKRKDLQDLHKDRQTKIQERIKLKVTIVDIFIRIMK